MTDLRQGVTETQHAVLDLIEQRAELWSIEWDFEERLHHGAAQALLAKGSSDLNRKRHHAMTAAALLIDAADEISRLINAAPTANELKHDKFFRLDGSPQTTGDPS